ncbi:MAG TPA: TonB family protein, partial [Epsilonproteobacteria bacterium]|nr:TonB family protein [Campylobacterota bacterium]
MPEPETVPEPKPKPKPVKKIKKQAKKLKPKLANKKVVKKSQKSRAASSRQQFRRGENALLLRVRASIIRNKKYPRAAIKRNIQGRVKVVFDIEKNGRVSHIRVSGGSKLLQRAARKSVSRSFP